MKKILSTILLLLFVAQMAFADIDYQKIYEDLQPPDFSYIHAIDPDQYYDMQHYAWSPYPLFRLNSEVYFKNQTIEPGYYLLTPRKHEDKWYILFKENGNVKYTIPCYKDEIVSELFYQQNLPKEKLTPSQKIHIGFVNAVGHFNSGKRRQAPRTFLEIDDLDNDFVSIVVYYGARKYYILLRSKMK